LILASMEVDISSDIVVCVPRSVSFAQTGDREGRDDLVGRGTDITTAILHGHEAGNVNG
jgi:hypothetical protein